MLFVVGTKILALIFDYESIFKYIQVKSFILETSLLWYYLYHHVSQIWLGEGRCDHFLY